MEDLYLATLIIVSLAVGSAFLSYYLKISIALIEIIVGIIGGYLLQLWFPEYHIDINSAWFTMLSSVGALMLTFLAGIEIDAATIKREWGAASVIGIASFIIPFIGCSITTYYGFAWSLQSSLLAGLVLSTTSVAVVYGTLLECELTETQYGKTILSTCFVTDFCTVISLGLLFSPFTIKAIIFFLAIIFICILIPPLAKITFNNLGGKPTAFEIKFILFFLLILGLSAIWAGYEPVLPAFFVGMALSKMIDKDHMLIKELQTITFGLMTPFYFIRAGFLVSVPVLITSITPIVILLLMKVLCKGIGIYPAMTWFGKYKNERIYTVFLMSTGLAFGSIAAMFGLTHHILDQHKYSLLIAAVVTSAIIPTIVANIFFFPANLIKNENEPI